MSSQPVMVLQPTPDERSMAMVNYILGFFFGFLGPLIIFFVGRESLFVKLHAMQLLLFHSMILVLVFGGMFVFFIVILAGAAGAHATGGDQPPIFLLLLIPLIWGGIIVLGIANLILTVIGAIKANEGIWWRYPITGRLAEKFLGVNG